MSGRQAVHLLVDIVAKGGNLLLNIAPGPEGQWHEGAYEMLKEMGDWMDVNSEAIYETRAIEPYKSGNVCLTSKADGTIYTIYLVDKLQTAMPGEIVLNKTLPLNFKKVYLLGFSKPLKWEATESEWIVNIPKSVQNNPPSDYAWVLKFQP
jgi:alpha-L-fucosidase